MTNTAKSHKGRGPPAAPASAISSPKAGGGRALAIGDLARQFGITTRTIRFYETRGLLSPSRHGANRSFDAQDRQRLALIVRAKNLGLSLEEIAEQLALFDAAALGTTATPKLKALTDRQIATLLAKRADLASSLGDLRRIRIQFERGPARTAGTLR